MKPEQTERVFLVDDDLAVLKALARLLSSFALEVVCYGTAQEFLSSGNLDAPGCLVLDLSMPEMDGMALQQALNAEASVLPLIFLTGHGDIATGVQAMKFGAADFLTKPVDSDRLLNAVQLAMQKNRQARLTRAERELILQRYATLTPREREVLKLVAQGKLNKQTAAELGTVEKTVKAHRAHIMTKMQANSLAELVRQMVVIDTLEPQQ